MCEIPSNVIESDRFSPMVDGVSIGGNDLLQLTLGVDRDSDRICYLSNDQNISYRRMISQAIKTYKENGVKVGFCGQQPSDSLEFCAFLINENIDTISVTPDSGTQDDSKPRIDFQDIIQYWNYSIIYLYTIKNGFYSVASWRISME